MWIADRASQFRLRTAMSNGAFGVVAFAARQHAELILSAIVFQRSRLRTRPHESWNRRCVLFLDHLAFDDFVVLGANWITDWTPPVCAFTGVVLGVWGETTGATAFATDAYAERGPAFVLAFARVAQFSHLFANAAVLRFIFVLVASFLAFAHDEFFVRLALQIAEAIFVEVWRTTLAGIHSRQR